MNIKRQIIRELLIKIKFSLRIILPTVGLLVVHSGSLAYRAPPIGECLLLSLFQRIPPLHSTSIISRAQS